MPEKLVRDLMPEVIERNDGRPYPYRKTAGAEYAVLLNRKLLEESKEFCAAWRPEDSLEELADIMEVIFCQVERLGYTRDDLERVRLSKAADRGSFREGIVMNFD